MLIRCEEGGEHKACDRCRKVFREQSKDATGRPTDPIYAHCYYTSNIDAVIMLCTDCRIRWDNMTRLWLSRAIFVVREDQGWVEVTEDAVHTVVGHDGKSSAVIGVGGKPRYTAGRASIPTADH